MASATISIAIVNCIHDIKTNVNSNGSNQCIVDWLPDWIIFFPQKFVIIRCCFLCLVSIRCDGVFIVTAELNPNQIFDNLRKSNFCASSK